MKKLTTLLFFLYSCTLFSQIEKLDGEYSRQLGSKDKHMIEYKLTLHQDGSFFFHSYTNHKNGISWEENKYGKGSWSADGTIVSFFTDPKNDLDQKHTLNFSNSKARFITKPSRDKSDRVIKTRLRFFQSGIFWMEGLDIFKVKNAL